MGIAARLHRTLTSRFAAWVRRRQGGDSLPVDLHRRRLYILPTRAGAGFALLLLGMLVAGLNYANSVALLLTFMLGGLALAAMHLCHGNLLDTRIVGARVEPSFAGESGRLEIVLDAGASARYEWRISVHGAQGESLSAPVQARTAERAVAHLPVPAPTRGVYSVGRVRVSTVWPFGLFRAWTWLHLPLDLIVYPAARGVRPASSAAGRQPGEQERADAGDDEWRGLRGFRDGDSPRRIAWKAYARGGPLLVGDYAAEGSERHEFDFELLAPLALEARLEQLCRWIVDAEQRGESYSLRLPREYLPADSGALHRHHCLAALARVRA